MQIIDLHCDTIAKLKKNEGERLAKNSFSVDLEKLRQGESMAQFFALFVDQGKVEDPLREAKEMLALFAREMEDNETSICLAKNYADLMANQKENKISAFLTIEEGGVLQGRMENLEAFYALGVRLITLTWNYPNELGYPNHKYEFKDCGLTSFGRDCVERMNALGMIVDVAHLSDKGFYDVAEASVKPFVASHSNSRSVREHSRNLTDEMIRLLAEKGGVMGINFAASFLGASPESRIDDMTAHIQHIYRVGGIETIAFGTDFDGISSQVEIRDFSYMQKLIEALRSCGLHESEIEKMASKNVMRIIKECLV